MNSGAKKIVLFIMGSTALVLGYLIYTLKKKEKFESRHSQGSMGVQNTNYSFKQPLYFEGMPPSLKVENTYHNQMLAPVENGGCDGDYTNIECRQKAYIKTMKDGTTDKADLICYRHRDNEDEYYACLDAVYGNYLWMDRGLGTDSCKCFGPPSYSGTKMHDGSCFCPSKRELKDRRMVDENDNVVW